jgi:hypothetical protein
MSNADFVLPVQLMALLAVIQADGKGFGTSGPAVSLYCALGEAALEGATAARLQSVYERYRHLQLENSVHQKVLSSLLTFCSTPYGRLMAASAALAEIRERPLGLTAKERQEATYQALLAAAERVEAHLLATMDE